MKKLLVWSVVVAVLIYLLDSLATTLQFGPEHYVAGLLSVLLLHIIVPHLE